MIFRKNQINPEASEVMMMVSFTTADCWRWLNTLYHRLSNGLDKSDELATETTFTEEDLASWLSREPTILGWMPEKHATPICKWCIRVARDKGYLVKEGKHYMLTERMGAKNGRPKES